MRIDPKIIIFVLLAAFVLSIGFTVQKIAALPDILKSDVHVDQNHIHKLNTPINKMMWMAIISGILASLTMALIVYRNKYIVYKNRVRSLPENDLTIIPAKKEQDKVPATDDGENVLLEKKTQLLDEIEKIGKNHTEIKAFANAVISEIAKAFEASQGVFYIATEHEGKNYLELRGGYAFFKPDDGEIKTLFGIGLAGQVAKAQQPVNIDHVPEGYIDIISGLGQATPTTLIIFPLLHQEQTIGVIEFASFRKFNPEEEQALLDVGQAVANLLVPILTSTKKSTTKTTPKSLPGSDKGN